MKAIWYPSNEEIKKIRESKILEYFNKFPEPYRTQAIHNLKKFPITNKEKVSSVRISLGGGFIWDKTPEGREYWTKFYHSLII